MPITTLISYLIAIAIPAFAVYLIFALDLFSTGKKSNIALSMGWGAVGAFGFSYLVNTAFVGVLGYDVVVGGTAPIIEEILKSLILVYLIRRPSFRYVVDGAVYGFAVGIGFAVTENIFYLNNNPEAALSVALSRVLSTSLMHATASAMVGIALGRLRRVKGAATTTVQLLGILTAITLHVVFNNIVNNHDLSPLLLLVLAIAMGLSGSGVIAYLIVRTLQDEKKRFAATLDPDQSISVGERKAIQRLGGAGIEEMLEDLDVSFGHDNIALIRRLLVKQANVGILQNNLNGSQVTDRLRKAWEQEIADLRADIEDIRRELGRYVMSYLSSVFPIDDTGLWNTLIEEMGEYDPTMVHTFDTFMRMSQLAHTFTPEQMQDLAEELHRIDIFKYVSMADLENLSRAISIQTFEDGKMLFDQGDEGDAMYLIKRGNIAIYTVSKDTGEQQHRPLRVFGEGQVVGDFAVLDGQPRSARAYAEDKLTAIILRRQVFMMFIKSRPQVMLAVLHVLSEKARYTTSKLQDSINWVSNLAQGNFDRVASQPLFAEASARAAATEPPPPLPDAEEEVSELAVGQTETAASPFGGVYNRVASALNRRDREQPQPEPQTSETSNEPKHKFLD